MTLRIAFILLLFLVCPAGCLHAQLPTPLENAIYDHDYSLVAKLLSSGEDPNEKDKTGSTPLECAVEKDDTLILKMLIDHGANIHSYLPPFGNNLLNLCVYINKFKAAKYLIENGLNVDSPDGAMGESPLIQAIQINNIFMISFLIKHGANPNFIWRSGQFNQTPLQLAIFGRLDVHSQIMGTIDNILTRDSSGDTRRMLSLQIIQLLLKGGASAKPQVPLDSGKTYLHEAAAECDTEIVRLLLQYGADKSVKNDAGERPYDVAVKNGCKDLETILK
jgi:ankyrin repeat protein